MVNGSPALIADLQAIIEIISFSFGNLPTLTSSSESSSSIKSLISSLVAISLIITGTLLTMKVF